MMRSRTIVGVAVAVIAAVLAFGLWSWRTTPLSDSSAVVNQVRRLSQLVSVRYSVQKVVGLKEPGYWIGEDSILLIVQANIDAGVDLSKLSESAIEVNGKEIIVRLPPAEIINVAVDEKATQVWDRRKTWWAPWVPYSRDLESRARIAGLEAARKSALEMGILKQAENNAEMSIRTLLTLAGAEQVRVIRASVS